MPPCFILLFLVAVGSLILLALRRFPFLPVLSYCPCFGVYYGVRMAIVTLLVVAGRGVVLFSGAAIIWRFFIVSVGGSLGVRLFLVVVLTWTWGFCLELIRRSAACCFTLSFAFLVRSVPPGPGLFFFFFLRIGVGVPLIRRFWPVCCRYVSGSGVLCTLSVGPAGFVPFLALRLACVWGRLFFQVWAMHARACYLASALPFCCLPSSWWPVPFAGAPLVVLHALPSSHLVVVAPFFRPCAVWSCPWWATFVAGLCVLPPGK